MRKNASSLLIILLFPFHFLFAGETSIYQKSTKWTNPEVKVCFGGNRIPLNQLDDEDVESLRKTGLLTNLLVPTEGFKRFVQNTIESEYTKDKTGIHFTGWKDCGDQVDWNIVFILGSHESPSSTVPFGLAPLGPRYGAKDEASAKSRAWEKSYVFIDRDITNKKPEILQLRILHEFGHAAGLRHEDARPEARSDPLCIKFGKKYGEPLEETIFYGVYDPASVMNTCLDLLFKSEGNYFKAKRKLKTFETVHRDMGITHLGLVNHIQAGRNVERKQINKDGDEIFKFLPKLSEGDLHTLRCIYVHEGLDYQDFCE